MIEPNDCIPTIFSVPRNGDRCASSVADDEGTGGVEGDADDFGWIGAGFGKGAADGLADGGPDLLAVMLGEIGVGAPHENGIFAAAQQFTFRRKDTGPGAARADVDAYQEVLRHPAPRFSLRSGAYRS